MSEPIVRQCADLGVYVFRINLSHTPLESVAPAIEAIRQCARAGRATTTNTDLTSILQDIEPAVAEEVVRSFSAYFGFFR